MGDTQSILNTQKYQPVESRRKLGRVLRQRFNSAKYDDSDTTAVTKSTLMTSTASTATDDSSSSAAAPSNTAAGDSLDFLRPPDMCRDDSMTSLAEQLNPLTRSIHEDFKISKYVLGMGINGKVVECIEKKSGRRCALKVSCQIETTFVNFFFILPN